MRHLLILSMLGLTLGCAVQNSSGVRELSSLSARPAADVERDAGRKPFEVLQYLGVEPGMTTLDVIASSGYYTEALAHAVGLEGRVYSQNPALALRFFDGRNDHLLNQRLFGNRLPNVRRLDRAFDDLGLVDDSVDVAVTALNFHDVYNASPEQAHEMLLAIRRVLKPGGVLGLIDHDSNPGADHAALHRMPMADAIAAAEAAGFTVETSDLLRNPADDRSAGPFSDAVRGQTDRFVLKLVKPSS